MPHPAELGLVSVERFYVLGLGEAYTSHGPSGVTEAELLPHLYAGLDEVLSALGSRVTRPILVLGADLETYAYEIAAWSAVSKLRGLAGPDREIIQGNCERARARLKEIASPDSSDQKPYYVDSTAPINERGPLGGTSPPGDLESKLGSTGCWGFRRCC